jgi:hypothetical protein
MSDNNGSSNWRFVWVGFGGFDVMVQMAQRIYGADSCFSRRVDLRNLLFNPLWKAEFLIGE